MIDVVTLLQIERCLYDINHNFHATTLCERDHRKGTTHM